MSIYDLSKLSDTIQTQIILSPKYADWFSKYPDKLLGVDTNAKTIKGIKYDIETAILYLSPGTTQVVIYALCLALQCAKNLASMTAGRGAMGTVQMSRLRKTLYLLQYT
jgi:hypothetical protein